MTLRRVGLSNSLSSQAKISNRRFTLSRVSLRRFPFPTAAAAAAVVNYVEDVFSTYLYTGNGSTQTITNNIDLSTKGGLVWIKSRSAGFLNNVLSDTSRGNTKILYSNLAAAQDTFTDGITAFNTTGFSLGASSNHNESTYTFASWTFRKQQKFFDIVTYTGNGVAGTQISHNLGSTPGCIIVKKTDGGTNWAVYHRGLSGNEYLNLNNTDSVSAIGSGANVFGNGTSLVAPTSSAFTVGVDSQVNSSGGAYIAYLFAHDAGGFGATGSDNVISCGLFTYSSGTTVNLGYEPQWILIKRTDSSTVGGWYIIDAMRIWATDSDGKWLLANSSGAETSGAFGVAPTSTGFRVVTGYGTNSPYIYIAIRRGPMQTPTSGTSVFKPVRRTGNGSTTIISAGFPIDASFTDTSAGTYLLLDRLRSGTNYFRTISTDAEAVGGAGYDTQDGYRVGTGGTFSFNTSSTSYSDHFFRRAPGFFDIVFYTGTTSAATFNHNLTAVPELMIVKRRDSAGGWIVYFSGWSDGRRLVLQSDSALISADSNIWNNTEPTSTQFTVGSSLSTGSATYMNYLFASCPGVSKVGSYTGNGSSQTINCGFSAGARYILIKRTDSTGDWTIFDSALGIVDGNEDFGRFNSPGGVSGTVADHIDPTSVGFIVNQVASSNINVNNATYIFLAIA